MTDKLIVTGTMIQQFAPKVPLALMPAFLEAVSATQDKYQILTPMRVAHFMAQASFETGGFTGWVENLNYSTPARLVAVWPSRFTLDKSVTTKAYAPEYVNNPQKLANLVYANRNGNGPAGSNDGYNFRGRGAFHLTGRANYEKASVDIYGDNRLVDNPDSVMQYHDGLLTAGWFWNANGLGVLADKDEFTIITTRINGSSVTVKDRLAYLGAAKRIFVYPPKA